MSGTSNVGQSSVYEAGDQRNYKDSEIETAERYHEGKEHSHKANDSSMPLIYRIFSLVFALVLLTSASCFRGSTINCEQVSQRDKGAMATVRSGYSVC